MKGRGLAGPLAAALLAWSASAAGAAGAGRAAAERLSPEREPPNTPLAIGVAAFERVSGGGERTPEVAGLLAERLLARGVERVVGPESLGLAPVSEPAEDEVRTWAGHSGLDALVVGRATRLGRRVSVDARLRSGASGAVLDTYVVEIGAAGELDAAVDRLAGQIVSGARRTLGPPPVASGPEDAAAGREADESPDLSFGLRSAPGEGPIRISAAESEFLLDENRTIFKRDVRVTRGDVTLTADRLESFFAGDRREPEKLVATGNVRVAQGDQSVRCERATFEKATQRILCRGNARARVGRNTARGEEIEFRLDESRIYIRGGAQLRIEPEDEAGSSLPAAPEPAGVER